jgi:hypothetical protein
VMVDDAVLGEGVAVVAGHFFTEYAVMVWFVLLNIGVSVWCTSCGGVAA